MRSIIAGNWKMYKGGADAAAYAEELVRRLGPCPDREVVVAPPFTALAAVAAVLKRSPLKLAAQNMHDAAEGAYTGEIAASMLIACGCTAVIIGHSERRQHFGETGAFLNRKLRSALNASLRPIFCIGETLAERESGKTFGILEKQIKEGLQNLQTDDIGHLVVAYEPVWAIGTGRTATPGQAAESHAFIRKVLTGEFGPAAMTVPLLYGGSVNEYNIADLLAEDAINGALVGGASLKAEAFAKIVSYRVKKG